ncbi:CPBP family intramembrane metalloprotease [Ruegeria sediminis]|uniref:CPBP family intramembrane metalloprotease n=1 Tax=Ruegeria sediminis TaxID=2583820 RepID=A0ABY2WWX5_9RHOB|nr:CPBP family intramembrane glutamic endopeptidase [Ruegeria sediminis]TMV06916.1 CPBP family intramembrane metalloprotease [Ruegeria sediminis]
MAADLTGQAYAAHERLVAPARARPEIWRLLAGLALLAVVVFGLNASLLALVAGLGSDVWVETFLSGSTPVAMLVLLGSFGFVILGVALAARQMQRRMLQSIVGPYRETLAQFWQVLRVLLVLGAVILALPPYDMGAPLKPNLAPLVWLAILPFSLMAILIQTSAEEILFRGYLQQCLAARFRSPVIWMGLPSVLFALGHYVPAQAGENAFLIALWSGTFGLLMADLTARAGTLGPAIALHFFNNLIALLFIALPGSLDGLALFLLPYEMSDTGHLRAWLVVDFALMLVAWLTARIALRR